MMAWQQTKKMNKMRALGFVTAGASVVYLGYEALKTRPLYDNVLMPVVRMLPAETSHNLAVWACKNKFFPSTNAENEEINLATNFFGTYITNPIGIAAGFDKHGEAIEGLREMGFGFVEVGSVTPKPQFGNPLPRVFRLTSDNAVINRYGFNSEGHQAVLERIQAVKANDEFSAVIGVNLGRNRKTSSVIGDYVQGVETFGPIADYLVINVSSPNTKGVRTLQSKEKLERLLTRVVETRNNLPTNNKVPLLLKLSPDLDRSELIEIAAVINKKECRIDGLIVSNTTLARDNLIDSEIAQQAGGLSGEPLRQQSTRVIAQMYEATRGKIPIIGVGGIASGQDALEKLEAGASYLQLYTALVFNGPSIIPEIKTELSELLTQHGYESVEDAVGKKYRKYLN